MFEKKAFDTQKCRFTPDVRPNSPQIVSIYPFFDTGCPLPPFRPITFSRPLGAALKNRKSTYLLNVLFFTTVRNQSHSSEIHNIRLYLTSIIYNKNPLRLKSSILLSPDFTYRRAVMLPNQVVILQIVRSVDSPKMKQHVAQIVTHERSVRGRLNRFHGLGVFLYVTIRTPNHKRYFILVPQLIRCHRPLISLSLIPIVINFFSVVGKVNND